MRGTWIIAGLVLSLVIPWNCALPSPLQAAGEDDDDEIDSDEQEFNRLQQIIVNRLGLKPNVTAGTDQNQQLAEKASQFLAQYFKNVGTETPLKIPNASNHTIIITIVPNSNGTSNGTVNISHKLSSQDTIIVPPRAVPEKQVTSPPTQPTSTAPAPKRIRPTPTTNVDNIEDAILEALSFAQGQVPSNVAGPGASVHQTNSHNHNNNNNNNNKDNKINAVGVMKPSSPPSGGGSNSPISAPFPISPLSPENNGAVYVQERATAPPSPQYVESNTLAPLIFVALPPQQEVSTERQRPRPAGPSPLFLGLNLFGSLAEGDLGAAVENTFKLAEAPVVQDTARLAAVGLLHNVFQGFNCQVLGNCNRSPIKIIVP